MSIKMSFETKRSIEVNADFDTVFDDVSQVPKMAELFPKVESIEDLGGNKYKWTLEKVGVSKYSIQVVYAAEYSADKSKGLIEWKPVPGIGNGINSGRAEVKTKGDKTVIEFLTNVELDLPLPGLAKPVVKPFVTKEYNSIADQFEENVKKRFG